MDRRSCSPTMVTFILLLACLSVYQMIGCPGPPEVYEPSPSNTYSLFQEGNFTEQSSQQMVESLPSWDYSTLINLDNFRFKILNKNCRENETVDLLVLVHSAPGNLGKRNTIRQTWGGEGYEGRVKVVFLLGDVLNREEEEVVQKEDFLFGDLIQGNFVDAYRNMTYKHVMALKYAVYHCPQARYVLKTDDDVFVNMPAVISFLASDFFAPGTRKLLLCTPFHEARVKRSYRSKWRVSFKEYPDPYYPPYCPGWALLYSPDTVFRLYREAQHSEYFWIDDVYITGIIAKRINLNHVPIKNLVLTPDQVDYILRYNDTSDLLLDSYLYGPPDLQQNTIISLWKIFNKAKAAEKNKNTDRFR